MGKQPECRLTTAQFAVTFRTSIRVLTEHPHSFFQTCAVGDSPMETRAVQPIVKIGLHPIYRNPASVNIVLLDGELRQVRFVVANVEKLGNIENIIGIV